MKNETDFKEYSSTPQVLCSEINLTDVHYNIKDIKLKSTNDSVSSFYSSNNSNVESYPKVVCNNCNNDIIGTKFNCINCNRLHSYCFSCVLSFVSGIEISRNNNNNNNNFGNPMNLTDSNNNNNNIVGKDQHLNHCFEIEQPPLVGSTIFTKIIHLSTNSINNNLLNITVADRGEMVQKNRSVDDITNRLPNPKLHQSNFNSQICSIEINPNGNIIYTDGSGCAFDWLALDTISFNHISNNNNNIHNLSITGINCLNGHSLKYDNILSSYNCDRCTVTNSKKILSISWSCQQCDYDLCSDCYKICQGDNVTEGKIKLYFLFIIFFNLLFFIIIRFKIYK